MNRPRETIFFPFILLALLIATYAGKTLAQTQPSTSEASRYEALRHIVLAREFFPRLQLGKPIHGESMKNFCSPAFRDISSGQGFDPIEPVLQTEDQEHKVLRFWTRCGKDEEFIARTGAAFGFGTQGFRLYRVDVDRNPKNGLEEVLYAEWDHKNPPAHFSAGFTWMDPRTCTVRGRAPTVQRDTRDEKGVGGIHDSHAALVRYRQTIWALEVHSLAATWTKSLSDPARPPATSEYRLSMTTLPNAADKLKRHTCSWSTIRP